MNWATYSLSFTKEANQFSGKEKIALKIAAIAKSLVDCKRLKIRNGFKIKCTHWTQALSKVHPSCELHLTVLQIKLPQNDIMKIDDPNKRLLQLPGICFSVEILDLIIQIVDACDRIPNDGDEHQLPQHEKRANHISRNRLEYIDKDDAGVSSQMKWQSVNSFLLQDKVGSDGCWSGWTHTIMSYRTIQESRL